MARLLRPPELTPGVALVLRGLAAGGHQAYVVGGAPRDWLAGRAVRDVDVATDARPERVAALFEKVVPVGLQHATVTVVALGEAVEVTTYRRAAPGLTREGRGADAWGATVEEDLAARDFTLNALAWRPPDVLVDPFDGAGDLERRILRAVGAPDDRFREDPLRVLRGCRLAAALSLRVEPSTFAAMERHARACAGCSVERLLRELLALMEAPAPSVGVELMRECGLLGLVLPELAACVGVDQNRYHAFDVYRHSLAACDALPPDRPLLRLAGLLHDVGKPLAKQGSKFHGHEGVGAELVERRLLALRLGGREARDVASLVKNHMIDPGAPMGDGAVRRLVGRVGRELLDDQLRLLDADRAAKGMPDPEGDRAAAELRRRVDGVLAARTALAVKDLAVGGEDVMRLAGLGPGPAVGRLLEELLAVVLESPELNTPEALRSLLVGWSGRAPGRCRGRSTAMGTVVYGVDLGGTNLKAALVDEAGRILAEGRTPTLAQEGPDSIVSRVAALGRELFARAGVRVEDVRAVGLGAPGSVASADGVVLRCPNLPGWERYPLARRVEEELGGPVHVENDANAAALAEAWVGAGRGLRHVVCLTLGTGVGSGVVVDGRMLKGRGLAAELGHMIVAEGGRRCGCGARGCLEAYASASSVARRAQEALEGGGDEASSSSLGRAAEVTCKDVFDAAAAGDALARRLVADTARYLAAGLATCVNAFHPEMLVLTGGMIQAGDDGLLAPTRAALRDLALAELLEGVELRLSPLQDRAGVLGAAAVALAREGAIDLEA